MPDKGDDIRQRLAAQVQGEYNDKVRSGEILSGGLLPEPPSDVAAETPEPTPEPTPEAGKVFGKYDTIEKAQEGYFHLLGLTSRTQDENKQLKERLKQFESSLPPQPAQQPQNGKAHPSTGVLDWMKSDAVVKLSESTGIEPAQLAEFAAEVQRNTAQSFESLVEERLQPIQNQAQASQRFNALHPEAGPLQVEISTYVEAMPPHQRNVAEKMMRNGDVLEAMEYVYTNFQRDQQATAQNGMKANSQAAETGRVAKRAAAALPASPGTPIHADDSPDPKMMADLAERARNRDPDAQLAFRRLTFGRHLPPHLRTWEK